MEAVVGDVDAPLQFQLLQRSQQRRDSSQRLVIDAHNLPRTFQRQNRNGAEPTEQRREERRRFGAGKRNQPLPGLGIHRPPPPADQRARVSFMAAFPNTAYSGRPTSKTNTMKKIFKMVGEWFGWTGRV